MGMWVILIGDKDLTVNKFRDMKFEGSKQVTENEYQLDVIYENGYASFWKNTENENPVRDYEQAELAGFPFENVTAMVLKYSDIQILRDIVSAEDFPKDILIDCDGVELGLEKFIDRERLIL